MMMRSMPPASSALADRPVPAPPPIMGTPLSILSRKLVRIFLRRMKGIIDLSDDWRVAHSGRRARRDIAPRRDDRRGKLRIVDVKRQASQPPLVVCHQRRLD